ncbi:MAG: aldo/keto reductase [Myxococcota bacterium]|nr:aldo/keto reductase [Myxococcota bacterium]
MSSLLIDRARRPLGRSGLSAFPIAYGLWRFAGTDVPTARAKIDAALEAGIDLFDHADVYGCDGGGQFGDAEELFGRALAEQPSLRDGMIIASKGGIVLGRPYDSSAGWIRQACEDSLRRLGVDSIDLYQIHRHDFVAHPAELASVLTSLRDEGKIRAVGVSNYTPSQFRALQAHLPFPLATHQPEFSCWRHMALRDGVLDQCMETGVTPLAWSPLGGGVIGMTIDAAEEQPNGDRLAGLLKRLDATASAQGVSRSAVALAWVLAHPAGVIPIIGTQRPERILASLEAFDVSLDRATWNQILEAAQGEPLP